jgi:hypothetical protein
MAPDPVPPPDGRVIVRFREVDLRKLTDRWPVDDLIAQFEAIARGPRLAELLDEVGAAAPELAVVEADRYDEAVDKAAKTLEERLAEAPDAAAVSALFEEFKRLYRDRVKYVRDAILRRDSSARLAALGDEADADACVAMLAQAAVDYAIPASWWPEDCAPPPEDADRAARYAALRGDRNCESLYSYLLMDAKRIDPAVATRAPHTPRRDDRLYNMELPIELADVVTLVVPTLTSVALDRLVGAVTGWLRRRRAAVPTAKQIARIYGPDGALLKEVELTESTANSGT